MSVTEITTDPPGVGIVGGRGKSAGQVAAMVGELLERSAGPVFVTGTTPDQRAAIRAAWPEARYHARSGLTVARPVRVPLAAHVAVVTAGTSDLTVAEEAADAARGLGLTVTTIADVGVAGLHRLLAHRELLQGVDCAIVDAGGGGGERRRRPRGGAGRLANPQGMRLAKVGPHALSVPVVSHDERPHHYMTVGGPAHVGSSRLPRPSSASGQAAGRRTHARARQGRPHPGPGRRARAGGRAHRRAEDRLGDRVRRSHPETTDRAVRCGRDPRLARGDSAGGGRQLRTGGRASPVGPRAGNRRGRGVQRAGCAHARPQGRPGQEAGERLHGARGDRREGRPRPGRPRALGRRDAARPGCGGALGDRRGQGERDRRPVPARWQRPRRAGRGDRQPRPAGPGHLRGAAEGAAGLVHPVPRARCQPRQRPARGDAATGDPASRTARGHRADQDVAMIAEPAPNATARSYRGLSLQEVDLPLDEPALLRFLVGREVYRRTDYLALRNGDATALVRVRRASDTALFSPVVEARVLAGPEHTRWVEALEVDVGNATVLARRALAEDAPGVRAYVVMGRYQHVNFIWEPTPVVVRVTEVIPPEPPKLLAMAEQAVAFDEELPPIELVLDAVDIRDLAAANPAPSYLLPCRGSGIDLAAPVAFLDTRPATREPWLLIGCERSLQLHRHFYGDEPDRVDLCPRNRASASGPTLAKCCLLERGMELGDAVAVVPWGSNLDEVRQALRWLAGLDRPQRLG